MKLYSKNGSVPKTDTDGTEGWAEVPLPPTPGEGEELVWWSPPGWVIRPICPNNPGKTYNWSQSEHKWIETAIEEVLEVIEIDLSSSSNDVITIGSASEVITVVGGGSI
jgi:hypothetical protein